jgi:hypothetical protein
MNKYTRDNLLSIYKELNSFDKSKQYSKHLLYKISKNAKKISGILEEAKEKEESVQTKEFKEFEQGRLNILKAHSEKDENGTPIVENNTVQIAVESRETFDAEMGEYLKTNEELIKKYEKLQEEFKAWLLEEIVFEFETIKFEHLPTELDIPTYNLLSLMVEED